MRKRLLILAVILIIATVIFLALSGLFYHMHQNTMDASGDFYHRIYTRFKLFLYCGIVSFAGSAVLLAVRAWFVKT